MSREYCGINVETFQRTISHSQTLRPLPRIPKSSRVDILRGVLEENRLSPTLFRIFVADLIHELKLQFPNASDKEGATSVRTPLAVHAHSATGRSIREGQHQP